MYRIEFDRARSARFVKKADPPRKDRLEKELLVIARDPFIADELKGRFRGLRSHHFSHQGVGYRIVYAVYPEREVVGILHVGTRENFYRELARALG
jgi:mRNA-degrading endonuclease RelE of RelBE toxin-antitoxin system